MREHPGSIRGFPPPFFVVTGLIFGQTAALSVTAAMALLFLLLWFVLPLPYCGNDKKN